MSASDIADGIHAHVDELITALVRETRVNLAAALRGVVQDPGFGEPGAGGPVPAFSDEDSFLAGVTWAAQLVADEQFEF